MWVTDSKKERSKRSLRDIYHYNEKNLGLYEKAVGLRKEIETLREQVSDLFESMDVVTKEDLKKASE